VLDGLIGTKAKADMACPECGPRCTTKTNAKKPVLRIWRSDDGFLTYNCARCGAKGYVRERSTDWRKPIASDLPKRSAIPDADQARRVERALSIWNDARDIRDTPAETYLLSRGLDVSEDLRHVLRFSGTLRLDGKPVCGMVALMRDAATDIPCGVHRTFLTSNGVKLDRKMLGRAKGAAIKLDAHADIVSGLHIGEGIETCLAAHQLGYRPVWALGSAGAIADFPVLAGIEAITVFAENDDASNRAAEACGARYENAGLEAWICDPPSGDMNDLIRGAAA
jgi:Toprim domain